MQITEMNEPIKVRADFVPGGTVVPLLFKRREHERFRVRRVNATWEDRQQDHRVLYFSVSVGRSSDVFELCYREENRTWWLQRVILDG